MPQTLHEPDRIWILGDLLDGGREWDDMLFEEEVERFKAIFDLSRQANGMLYVWYFEHVALF